MNAYISDDEKKAAFTAASASGVKIKDGIYSLLWRYVESPLKELLNIELVALSSVYLGSCESLHGEELGSILFDFLDDQEYPGSNLTNAERLITGSIIKSHGYDPDRRNYVKVLTPTGFYHFYHLRYDYVI